MIRRIGLWGPVVAYMAIIFYESSQPVLPSVVDGVNDKVLHIGGYTALGALVIRALTDGFRRPVTWRAGLFAIALTTAYGLSDEVHQAFVPPREMDPWDLLADATGATLAVVALATQLAAQAPVAVRFILEAVGRGANQPLAEGLALEATLFGLVAATDDMREGTRAFLEKRKPSFKGR